MCDRLDNNDNSSENQNSNMIFNRFKIKLKESNYQMKCRKCKTNSGFVLLQKKDVFCQNCLLEYCTHKFRSTIGKSHLVKVGEEILVGFSGGQSSIAIVDLIKNGLNEDIHRKLRFKPALLYIDESILNDDQDNLEINITKELVDFMLESGLKCYFTTLQSSFELDSSKQYLHLEPPISSDSYEIVKSFLFKSNQTKSGDDFRKCFHSLHNSSSKYDFLQKLKTLIMVRMAKDMNFSKIFVASTMDELAVGLMNNISFGRGLALSSEINFSDDRFWTSKSILILRPMCEFSNKEIAFYLNYRKLDHLVFRKDMTTTKFPIKSSIHKLTEHFLTQLSEEFPSTFYTVYKTGNKLMATKDFDDSIIRCGFCLSILDCNNDNDDQTKYSAFDALKLTSILSTTTDTLTKTDDSCDNLTLGYYCYSCLKLHNEIGKNEFEKFCLISQTL